MVITRFDFIIFLCISPLILAGLYDSYLSPDLYGQSSYLSGQSFSPFGGMFNPLFPSAPAAPFGWPQYGTATPWSNGGLFGLTRMSGHSDRYGGNLGYNYGCIPFCRYGGGFL